jgi:hypothetical protein
VVTPERILFHHQIAHLLGGVDDHPFAQVLDHAGDVTRQPIAAQVLLLDDQQIDAEAFGVFADGLATAMFGGIDRTIHAEAVEDLLRFHRSGPRASIGA